EAGDLDLELLRAGAAGLGSLAEGAGLGEASLGPGARVAGLPVALLGLRDRGARVLVRAESDLEDLALALEGVAEVLGAREDPGPEALDELAEAALLLVDALGLGARLVD